MKTHLFNTQRNFRFSKKLHTTKIDTFSQTVPNESFTIQELLERFTRGADPYITKIAEGHDSEELDDFEDVPVNFKPDLTDLDDAREFINEIDLRVNKYKDQLKKAEEEKKKIPKE